MVLTLSKEENAVDKKNIPIDNWITGSRLPVHRIVYFIYFWACEMTSVSVCKRELGIGTNAIVDWNYERLGVW